MTNKPPGQSVVFFFHQAFPGLFLYPRTADSRHQ